MFSNITFIYKCKVLMYIYRSIMYFLDIKILSLAQINNLIIFHWKKNVLIYILFLYFLWNDESICFWWIMSLLRDCWTSNYNLLFWVDKTVTVGGLQTFTSPIVYIFVKIWLSTSLNYKLYDYSFKIFLT